MLGAFLAGWLAFGLPPGLPAGSGALPLPPPVRAQDLFLAAQESYLQGDHDRARRRFERVLRLDPSRADVRRIAAYFDERLGRLDRARARFARLVAENPGDRYARVEEVKTAILAGDLEAAGRHLDAIERGSAEAGSGIEDLEGLLEERLREHASLGILWRRHAWGTGLVGLVLAGAGCLLARWRP